MVFERNPYFHRLDPEGRQLPYVDKVLVDVASPGLFPAKSNAGEVDLQARGLSMNDVPVLKEGEAAQNYRTLLWPYARGFDLQRSTPTSTRPTRVAAAEPATSATGARCRPPSTGASSTTRCCSGSASRATTPCWRPPVVLGRVPDDNAAYDPELANGLLDEMGLTAAIPPASAPCRTGGRWRSS